jgi:hypothetical protein
MDVKLHKGEWEGLGAEERKKIEQIIGSNFKDMKIIPDLNAAASRQLLAARPLQAFNLSKPVCTAACGIAEAAAVAACAALSGPAIPICVVAAHAAGDYCRSRC